MSNSAGVRDLSGLNLGTPVSPSRTNESSPEITKFPELPAAPPSKVVGSGYSPYHPVPTVQGYREQQKSNEKEADEYARIVAIRAQEQADRQARAEAHAQPKQENGDGTVTPGGTHKDSGNKAKMQENNKDDANAKKPATEKQRMMDQMNAHNRE